MASRILVYQTAFWGDLLLAGPLLKRIAELFPQSEIHLVCRKGFGSGMIDFGLVHVVHEYDKSHHPSLMSWVRRFHGLTFDLLICPHQSVRSMLAVSMIRSRRKIGFASPLNFLVFDHRVQRPMELPDYLRQLALLAPIDPWLRGKVAEWRETYSCRKLAREDLWVPAPPTELLEEPAKITRPLAESRLSEMVAWVQGGPTILVAPGSQWNTKRWTTDGFKTLIRKLIENGYRVGLIGSPSDHGIASAIATEGAQLKNWVGKTTPSELAALMEKARALVTNDSGPMHLASVVQCPTVAIFGPTTLDLGYQPLNPRSIVVQEPLACRPCGLHGHEKCPIGTHDCMNRISVDRVIAAVQKVTV